MIGGIDRAVVLSEIHPDRILPQNFNPLWQFQKGYGLNTPDDQDIWDEIFVDEIKEIHRICQRENRVLFIRDHFHRDIIINQELRSRLCEVLSPHFNLKRIYTYRDPMEIWSSMKLRNWQEDLTVSEFLDLFHKSFALFENDLNLSYHEACIDPKTFTQTVFDYAGMSEEAGDYVGGLDARVHYTGQSGRQGPQLSPRPARWGILSDDEIRFFNTSEIYKECCRIMDLPELASRQHLPPRIKGLITQP